MAFPGLFEFCEKENKNSRSLLIILLLNTQSVSTKLVDCLNLNSKYQYLKTKNVAFSVTH